MPDERPPLPFDAETAEVVTRAVIAAGNRALDWFRQPLHIENKNPVRDAGTEFLSRWDPVTEADRSVEAQLRRVLADLFPDHEIVGEEAGSTGSGRYRWVIDPIDGTRAFVSGQPLWATLLGLQDLDEAGRPLAGWLYQPVQAHLYVAVGNHADFRPLAGEQASRPLTTSDVTHLGDAVLLCTHPDMFVGSEATDFGRVERHVRMSRFSGDAVNYGYLATGFADLVIENQLQPYDVVPLIPLVEAAGGVITDRNGRPPLNGGWAIAAANPTLHAAALELLNARD